ncbi:MAG: hypothetical protein AB7V24_16635, partial [Steroidobacteraceae bacterium]
MGVLKKPPELPMFNSLDDEVKRYLIDLHDWFIDIYNNYHLLDLPGIKVSSDNSVPNGGTDGDLYIRKAGASTALYINKNGT